MIPADHAHANLPFGRGMARPTSLAASIHSPIMTSAFATASSRVLPSAMHPGSSGTSTRNTLSRSLQYMIISYFDVSLFMQIVLQNRISHLLDLVCFGLRSERLQVEDFFYIFSIK